MGVDNNEFNRKDEIFNLELNIFNYSFGGEQLYDMLIEDEE